MYYVFELYNLSDQRGETNWSTKRPCRESQPQSLEAFETCDHLSGCLSRMYFIWNGHCCILLVWILLQFKWNIPGRFTRLKKLWPKLSREERRREGKKHYISFNNSFKPYFVSQISWSSQVKGAAETGVKGFAGRPLRPWLPHLQAARRPHGGRGGNHLAEDAVQQLAVLPWSRQSSLAVRKKLEKGLKVVWPGQWKEKIYGRAKIACPLCQAF